MRYLFLLTLLTVPFTVLSAVETSRTISVSGEAEVRVAPDQVIISMAAINKERTLDAAKKANDTTVNGVISYFTDTLKIAPKHVQTDRLSVEPVYLSCSRRDEQQGVCDPSKIQYYNLEKGIQLRLDDLSKYEALVAKSFELGVNKIIGIQFVSTELRKHKDKAREMAAIAAKEKAQAVAGTLGMKLGKPFSINLGDGRWSYLGRSTVNTSQNIVGSGADGNGSSLAVGQISITASVSVNFEMN